MHESSGLGGWEKLSWCCPVCSLYAYSGQFIHRTPPQSFSSAILLSCSFQGLNCFTLNQPTLVSGHLSNETTGTSLKVLSTGKNFPSWHFCKANAEAVTLQLSILGGAHILCRTMCQSGLSLFLHSTDNKELSWCASEESKQSTVETIIMWATFWFT